MAGNEIYYPQELENTELDDGDIKEISAILSEKTIDKVADLGEPQHEGGDIIEGTAVFADKSIDNTVILESSSRAEEAKGNAVSHGEEKHVVGYPKRSAATILGASISKLKVPSRYLRASVGSCHDFCKFGHKKSSEEKKRRSITRTISESNLNKAATRAGSKEKSFVRRLSFPGMQEERVSVKSTNGPKENIELETTTSSPCMPGRIRNRKSINEVKTDMKVAVLGSPRPRAKEMKIRKDVGSSSTGSQKLMARGSSSVSSRPPVSKASSMNPRIYRNLESRPVESKGNVKAEDLHPDDVPEKTLYMIQPNGKDPIAETPQSAAPRTPKGHHARKTKGSRGFRIGFHAFLSPSSPSSKSALSKTQGAFPLKGEEQQVESGYTHAKQGNTGSRGDKFKTKSKSVKTNTEQHKLNSKRVEMSQSEDKPSQTWKLKFRRGSAIDLSNANSSPKKIKFKRGKSLNEIQFKDGPGRRSFKSKEVTYDESRPMGDESEKVVLRHQEVASKGESLNLNNVLEETATKLVKTRRSKVKALVGAFESLMSVRERKASVVPSDS